MCGDGIIHSDEQCDDGNTEIGDGCNHLCEVEPGFICESINDDTKSTCECLNP